MKFLFVLSIAFLAVYSQENDAEWLEYKKTYMKGRSSVISLDESKRYGIWKENNDYVKKHNQLFDQGKVTFKVGIDEFSVYTNDELNKMRKGLMVAETSPFKNRTLPTPRNVPTAIDWRTRGWVSNVKNQGSCGSCWAFSAVGLIEGQLAKRGISLRSLSAQNLLDCVVNSFGCQGGYVEQALLFSISSGIMADTSYPYTGFKSSCRHNSRAIVTRVIDGYRFSGEENLRQVVGTYGPVSILMYTNTNSFMRYRGGIYFESACTSFTGRYDHAMLVVGYGTENGIPFWIVKNTWGTSWGENGYMRIRRGSANCGIGTYNLYAIL